MTTCPYCGANAHAGSTCPACGRTVPVKEAPVSTEDLRRLTAALEAGRFPPHIAQLPFSDRVKRAFTFFEACGVTQPWGLFPSPSKNSQAAFKNLDFKGRYAFNRLSTVNIWWAFFFGPLYYLAVGMWKKGLVLLFGLLLFGLVFAIIYHGLLGAPQSQYVETAMSLASGWAVSVMATYDLYRFTVKKENFWW